MYCLETLAHSSSAEKMKTITLPKTDPMAHEPQDIPSHNRREVVVTTRCSSRESSAVIFGRAVAGTP